MLLDVLVPRTGYEKFFAGLHPGSAMVSRPADDQQGTREVFYEGNVYNAPELRRFQDKLLHAAGRLANRYPTIARMTVPAEAVIVVATYDTVRWDYAEVVDAKRLLAYSGEAIESPPPQP